jgi:uncharacterized membrane protein YedE/YeeE
MHLNMSDVISVRKALFAPALAALLFTSGLIISGMVSSPVPTSTHGQQNELEVFALHAPLISLAFRIPCKKKSQRNTMTYTTTILPHSHPLFSFQTQISRVQGFLNISTLVEDGLPNYDATLVFVLGAGVAVSFASYQYKQRVHLEKPFLCPYNDGTECSFSAVPHGGKPTVRLVIGNILFGVGWGLGGLCPGPALVHLAKGTPSVLYAWFPLFMAGKIIFPLLENRGYLTYLGVPRPSSTASVPKKNLSMGFEPLIPTTVDKSSKYVDQSSPSPSAAASAPSADRTCPATFGIFTAGGDDDDSEYSSLVKKHNVRSFLSLVPADVTAHSPTFLKSVGSANCRRVLVDSMNPSLLTMKTAEDVMDALDGLERPTLVVCKSGARATAVSRMWAAAKVGAGAEEIITAAEQKKEAWVNNGVITKWVRESLKDRQTSRIIFRQLFEKESSTYTYLIGDSVSREAILIDPVDVTVDRDLAIAKELGLYVTLGVNTHAHVSPSPSLAPPICSP